MTDRAPPPIPLGVHDTPDVHEGPAGVDSHPLPGCVPRDDSAVGDGPAGETTSGESPLGERVGGEAAGGKRRTMRIDVAYDGESFHGWQRQLDAPSVQGAVEAALERALGAPHAVVAAGRTDAGVHALQQVASFRTHSTLPAPAMLGAIAARLPPAIVLLALADVEESFHARRDAAWKWYRYRIALGPGVDPHVARRVWVRRHAPAFDRLAAAARPVAGRHDFTSFGNLGSSTIGGLRTIYAARWSQRSLGDDDDLPRESSRRTDCVEFDIVGDAFLYKMVRTLVGTMWSAAMRRQIDDPADHIEQVLRRRDRRAAGPAAPAAGLRLMGVAYPGELASTLLPPELAACVSRIVPARIGGAERSPR